MHAVLVANRGEIARRVQRSVREMGLRALAVYVEEDRDALFAVEADEAVLVDSYLDADAIIAAALELGADAVHPGYGFMAENASFAAAVERAGLIWIGPEPGAIEGMGDKLAAKRVAEAAAVPTLPTTTDLTVAGARAIGFPVMVKAAAGGGGKGMRVVTEEAQLADAVTLAAREAEASFGDGRLFLERYVARGRHVEVQLLGDGRGGLVHLGERECSLQRRHQKIIEETPSPVLTPHDREEICAAALRLGAELDYRSAGTVEFLYDEDAREFYFLEVNTRLQVEHPVTEAVTGVDLVREQLRVAAGEDLGYGQDDITHTGHAIEARLCAEDVATGFLPATGTLEAFAAPDVPGVRWDSGVGPGSRIGTSFDSMLAKVIAYGSSREEAARRLARALRGLHTGGVTTNRDLLVVLLEHPDFVAGLTNAELVEAAVADLEKMVEQGEEERAAVLASLWLYKRRERTVLAGVALRPAWRNGRLPAQVVRLAVGERVHEIAYTRRRDHGFDLGPLGTARIVDWSPDSVAVELGRRRLRAQVTATGDRVHVQTQRGTVTFVVRPRFPDAAQASDPGDVRAPMAGIVSEVRCTPGHGASEGDTLVVIEAMKMELQVRAHLDGQIDELCVGVGQRVDVGDVLLRLRGEG
ncbi:Acetyl/propionyl-CoA carboxylase, alpha subunit [Micromonospora inositola]|uniref:Acetyl/propionyl-CoA carboxylase, alpha subunit n=2 Tax=Micromonospora inositola TaxID=47865 RepID=A0A1C5JN76_9ACTN|nr:biotin carboxylase N-terminal domain-containing protein [Micromonospora inositola]SCG72035.1 Acetyl/propionyl-CoA carboxylase, alpha subunit [Micromonospora inositola]